MKPVAPLDAKKTLRSRMTRASKRFEQPKVTSAFDQFLSKAFDSSHLSTDLADFGAVLDSRRASSSSNEDELRMTTSQLESSIWDALGGGSGGGALEASVCAPDHSLRRALVKQDAEDAKVKLNKALSSLERCSFLYDEHVFDVTKPLHLKKDAGPRSLGELAQLRSAVHGVSAAMASSSPARSGATEAAAKRTVRRKAVPKYDAAELADDESSSGGSSIFDETESARSSMQSQRTSLDSSTHHATRPTFKHQAVSLPTHLSQVPSLASTPLRVMEVDVPLHEQGNDDADQGINDEMLAAITYANLPRTHPLRRDSIVIPQPVVRPPRRPVPALVIAEEKEDEEEPTSLASVGRSTSAPQLPCIAELGGSPTLPERTAKPAPLVLAPTLPPIAVDAELAGSVVSPLSAAVTAAANISMVQLQRDEPVVKPLSASVSAPCTPRDPRAVARRDAAESVLWRPDTARASTATTLRAKRTSPPPRLPRSRKRPTTVDMGVPLKGLGPTSIDVEALQALLRDAEASHPEDVEIAVEEGEEVQVLPCFAAGEGWSLMSHVHQVGEVTPRASRAPLEHIEFMDGLTPRVGDFKMAQPMPASLGLKRTHLELQHEPSFGFARQRSDSMSSAASLLSDVESGFSSDVPSLTSDTSSGAGYESDSSATSFSTASSGGDDEYALSSKGKGKVASQYKPGSRPPVMRSSILPYIKSSSPVARAAARRSGSLPSLLPRDSVEMHQQATTVLHRRQLSTDGDRTTVLWELRLPLQHIANVEQQQQQMQLANKKSRHVRERHATLAGQESFESPLYHHWDQSAKAE